MIFNSIQYALFLPLVFVAHWKLPRPARLPLLLVASYVFYGSWDYRFLTLIVISTVVDYSVGRLLGGTDHEARRRALLGTSLLVNLSILGFFKYFNFFVDSAAGLLSRAGLEPHMATLEIVLPVGISFYTFQTISYTFDVYRRRVEPCKSLLVFAVYVAYFPQLVAGPIERARRLLPQLQSERKPPDAQRVASAIGLIMLGLVKKVVVADRLALYVDQAYSDPEALGSLSLLLAMFSFAIQVYGDFSGYTDIARGSSRLFSIDLMENFAQPHLARNISEFWQRWHISLSSWLREYLYVPLGGNQRGAARTYRNLMITMFLGGLWHGAAWTYVIWGGIHGAYLSIHRWLEGTRHSSPQLPRAPRPGRESTDGEGLPRGPREIASVAATFGLIMITLVVFRSSSLSQMVDVYAGVLSARGPAPPAYAAIEILTLGIAMFAIDIAARMRIGWSTVALRRPVLAGAACGLSLLLVMLFSGSETIPFIYFQF